MTADAITTLATLAGSALKRQGLTLATAESCTGGGVAEAITRIAGSSEWFDRGFVTYSNQAKTEMLGVDAALITTHGAVSEETARAMARGAIERSTAAVALSVTGVAGPGGGSERTPVGTVCFAWCSRTGSLASERRRFEGDREAVRRQSVIQALQGLLSLLEGSL
jgi:nicotinamide-nucleotide amidase